MKTNFFKSINSLVNSAAWNKARDLNEIDFSYSEMIDILDYINSGLSEESDINEQTKIILEAMDRVPKQ